MKKNHILSSATIWFAASLSINCGDNVDQVEEPVDEIAPTTIAAPVGGTYRSVPGQVTLVANESSTIYYTVDGSEPTTSSPSAMSVARLDGLAGEESVTVRFFAVDDAGNAETPKEEAYTVMVAGPAPIRNLQIDVDQDAESATLTWDEPAGATEYIVAQVSNSWNAHLTDGGTYAVGAVLTDGEVLYAGTSPTFTATSLPYGGAGFAVWARHENNVYSAPVSGFAALDLGEQTGQLTMDFATGEVTVSVAPTGMEMSIEPWFANATDIGFYASLTNQSNRTLFNPKLVVTAISSGNLIYQVGTIDTSPYFYMSNAPSLAAGQSTFGRAGRMRVNGVVANATVTIDFRLQFDRGILGDTWSDDRNREFIDTGVPGTSRDATPVVGTGPDGYRRFVNASFSGDGRTITMVSGTSPSIWIVDAGTWEAIGGSSFNANRGKSGFGHAEFRDNIIYAVLQDGGHPYKWPSQSEGDMMFYLLKIDSTTLRELGRVQIVPGFADPETRAKRFAISADGTTAAVPILNWKTDYDDDATDDGDARSEIHLVDLETMTVTKSIDVTGHVTSQEVAFSPSGDTLYSGSTYEIDDFDGKPYENLAIIDVETDAITDFATSNRVMSLLVAADGKVWMGQDNGVFIYDPVAGTETQFGINTDYITSMQMITDDGETFFVTQDYDDYTIYDPATGDEEVVFSGNSSHYNNWFLVTPY